MESKNLKQKFADNLKRIRKSRKMTQEQLAENVGVDFRYISLLENAKNFPSCDLIEKIANAMNVNVSEFFIFEDQITRDDLENRLKNLLPFLDEEKLKLLIKIAKDMTFLN